MITHWISTTDKAKASVIAGKAILTVVSSAAMEVPSPTRRTFQRWVRGVGADVIGEGPARQGPFIFLDLDGHGQAHIGADLKVRRYANEPAPTDHLAVGEVGLPKLARRGGLAMEFVGCADDDERRAGDQVVCLEQANPSGIIQLKAVNHANDSVIAE